MYFIFKTIFESISPIYTLFLLFMLYLQCIMVKLSSRNAGFVHRGMSGSWTYCTKDDKRTFFGGLSDLPVLAIEPPPRGFSPGRVDGARCTTTSSRPKPAVLWTEREEDALVLDGEGYGVQRRQQQPARNQDPSSRGRVWKSAFAGDHHHGNAARLCETSPSVRSGVRQAVGRAVGTRKLPATDRGAGRACRTRWWWREEEEEEELFDVTMKLSGGKKLTETAVPRSTTWLVQ